MKSVKLNAEFSCKKLGVLSILTALLNLSFLSTVSKAQEAIMPEPAGPQPAWQQSEANEFQVFNPAGSTSGASQDQPFQLGPITARPHLLYSLIYATGLQSSTNNPQNTFIHEISPGILFDIGQ